MATTRKSDRAYARQQLQRLALAAGMTLSDGSPIEIGGEKCPPIRKIKEAIGFSENRMTRDQFSDAQDDYGHTRPYFRPTHEGSDDIAAILAEWSGESDCDGEMSLQDLLQITS